MEILVHRCTLLIAASVLFSAAAITMARRADGVPTAIRNIAISWLLAAMDTVTWMVEALSDPASAGEAYRSLLAAPLSLLVPAATLIVVCLIHSPAKQAITRTLFAVALPCCIALVDLLLLLVHSSEVAAAVERAFPNLVR